MKERQRWSVEYPPEPGPEVTQVRTTNPTCIWKRPLRGDVFWTGPDGVGTLWINLLMRHGTVTDATPRPVITVTDALVNAYVVGLNNHKGAFHDKRKAGLAAALESAGFDVTIEKGPHDCTDQ